MPFGRAIVQPNLIASWRDHRVALSFCFFAFATCALGIVWVHGKTPADGWY